VSNNKHPLPLAEVDGVKARPCLRSGFCCKQGICQFGEWDDVNKQCRHLGGTEPGKHFCMIYDFIMESNENWHFSPAFGAGCCSPFNEDRMKLVTSGLSSKAPS
jgi:hypothetical protein